MKYLVTLVNGKTVLYTGVSQINLTTGALAFLDVADAVIGFVASGQWISMSVSA